MCLVEPKLAQNRLWLVFCLKPNEARLPNSCDMRLLRHQLGSLGLAEIARRLQVEWAVNLTHQEWWERYSGLDQLADKAQKFVSAIWPDKLRGMQEEMGWKDRDMAVGKYKVRSTPLVQCPEAHCMSQVFLSHSAFRYLEDQLRTSEDNEMRMLADKQQQALEASSGGVSADPYGPFGSQPGSPELGKTLFAMADHGDSAAALPLVAHEAGKADAAGGSPWEADEEANSYMDARAYDASTIGAPSTIMFNNNQSNMFAGEKPEASRYDPDEPQKSETIETVKQTNKRRYVQFD